jgi:hypothetical protein
MTIAANLSFLADGASTAGVLAVTNGGSNANTLTGILKGNGTSAFTAATAGSDYVAPGTATTFTAVQTFTNNDLALLGSSTGYTTIASANSSATNYTATLPANTGTIAELNLAQTWTATQSLSGSSSVLGAVITNAAEVATVSATAATGTIALYPSSQSVLYYTSNASANWTVNITFSSGTTLNTAMSTGQALTIAFLVTQGTTAYYNSTVQVDGSTSGVTTKWQGGAPSAGNASGIDVYTYTVIKTASSTFTVLASLVQFK